jgi:alkylhydroperoxidase family enzyme
MQLFSLLAHSSAALADLKGATARALNATVLDGRTRELLILRVLHRYGAAAEWQAHVALFAKEVGLTNTDLLAIRGDLAPTVASDRTVLAVADALYAGGDIPDEVWSDARELFGTVGIVDLIFVGAQYAKVAMMTNALRIPPLRED